MEFVKWLFVKEWNVDFVKAKLGIKVEDFIEYLKENQSNWYVNIDILESKKGWLYAKLNDWKPDGSKKQEPKGEFEELEDDSTIPF